MTTLAPNPAPSELERLPVELDAGAYADNVVAPARKFAELEPLDVRAWGERRGIKLPQSHRGVARFPFVS